tara:strand:+ start:297 stop:503 length:207 start_codon:yes stop_codon:yes gene_type:complete
MLSESGLLGFHIKPLGSFFLNNRFGRGNIAMTSTSTAPSIGAFRQKADITIAAPVSQSEVFFGVYNRT